MTKKIKVAVLFGGCSDEYSVSLHSAAGVLRALDPQRYEIILIGIDRKGDWFLTSASPQKSKRINGISLKINVCS